MLALRSIEPQNLAGTISRTFAQLSPFLRYPPICGGVSKASGPGGATQPVRQTDLFRVWRRTEKNFSRMFLMKA